MLHVSRRTGTVCVKFSTWPDAQNPAYLEDTLRAFDAVGGFLAGRGPGTRRRRLAGVVSGLSRRGDTVPPPAHRGLTASRSLSTADRPGLNLAVSLPTGGFVTATPGSASSAGSRRHLNGIAEIRTFFRTNQQPIYFVGPTAFNLLGIDRWVRNFQYIAYYDSWDGQHPGCSPRRTARTSSSSPASRSTTTCSATPRSRSTCPAAAGRRWSRWCSSTKRPRRSAASRATR